MSETARLVISVDSRQVQQADRALGALGRTSSAVTSAVAAVTAGFGVREIYQAAEAYQTITNRMKLVTSSAVELAAAQSAVFGIAQKSGQSLTATAELYQRIAQNQDALKLSGEGVAGIVDTISKAMVISGASASSAQAALIQLGQAFASGTLRGEELNSVMEQAPALSQAIAAGMGKTVGQLRALGAEGKLTADAVIQALQAQAGAVDTLFGQMQDTMGTGLTRIGNSFTNLVGKMNEVSGVSASIAGSFTTVSEAVDSLTEDADSLAATVATVGAVMSGVAVGGAVLLANKIMVSVVASRVARAANIAQAESALQNAIANQRAAQTAVVRATAEAQAARGTAVQTHMSIQLAQARMREAAATATVTSAQVALTTASRGMLGVLGGPVGLALLAAGAAASYFLFRDATEEVQRSTLDLSAPLDQLTDKWRALGDAQRAVVGNDLRLKIDESKQSIISLSSEVEAAFNDLGNTKGLPVEAWLAPMREFRQAALDGGEGIHDFAQALTEGHPVGSDFRVMVEALAAKIESERDSAVKAAEGLKILENQTRASTSANQDLAGSTDSVGQKFLASLQQRADFAGQLTELQKVNIAIEKGYAGVLSETDIALARSNASLIDRANATKGVTKATNEQANAYQALYDRLYPAEAAQRKYTEEVDRLKTVLKGNELADAIDRLNRSIDGADATGPADAIEEYRKELERLEDQLDPVGKATEQYKKDVERLKAAMERGERSPERTAVLLAELEKQYKENTRATSDWAKWTEGALDRVDSAFADAWRNIGDGFSSFRDSLTNAFKQMLAELAHMAITKPIIMQIGAMMGIGGGTQGNNGIWGSLLGGGSSSGGGYGIQDGLSTVSAARNAYSLYSVGLAGMANTWGGYLAGAGNMLGMTGLGNFGIGIQGATLAPGLAGPTTIGAGGSMGAGAQAGSGLSSMGGLMANPATWIAAGMLASAKFYDAGYRLDTEDVARQKANKMSFAIDPALSGLLNLGVKTTELATKLLGGGKLANILTGGSLIAGVTGAVDKALFGGAWKTKDYGLGLSVAGGAFGAEQFEHRKKKGGLLSSSKKKTIWTELDPETAAALQETYDATEAGVASLFESLSLSVEEGSLAGLQLAREQISTKGKTEQEISEAISEWFGTVGEAMNAELNKVFGTGLEYDLAGMQSFVGNMQGVNTLFEQLNLELYESTVAGGRMAEQLSAVAGGFDVLAANVGTFYDGFYSAEEKMANTLAAVTKAFEAADVTLAGSRAEYRAMVDNIDRTTEAGREMFATLMALSGQAATYYSALEQQLMGGVNTAYAALQRSIANQQRAIQQQASQAAGNISALTGISNALDAALKKLRGTSDDAVRSLRAQAVMTLNSALVQARSGQSLAGFEGLQDALDVASNMDTALYRSLEDFEREQGRTANLIAELEKVNGKQLSAEQKMLKELEGQSKQLDEQLAYAQSQIDALNGIDNSVMGVAAAIAALTGAVASALSALPRTGTGSAIENTPENNATLLETVYRATLGRDVDAAGAAYWGGQLASGAIAYDQLSAAIRAAAAEHGEIPAFASGGFHSGGLRLVGENGPELEVTGPSRIYNASQTAAMLGGAGSTEELRALRGEVAGLRSALGAIAKYTESTAYGVRQMNEIGLPQGEAA